MKSQQESMNALMKVLSAFVRRERPSISSDPDWDEVRQLAGIHNVTAVLDFMILSYADAFTEGLEDQALRSLTGVAALMALRNAQMEETEKILAGSEIDYIPFKGYVLKDLYPEPELRSFGDVDILIRPGDREKCDRCLLDYGFESANDWEPVYSYRKGSLYLEVHTELLDTDISPRVLCRPYFREDPWGHVKKNGPHTYRFDREYHFLYLIAHIAKHISGSGAGIRMYLDLALVTFQEKDLEWGLIMDGLKEMHLLDLTGYIFLLMERCLGVSVPVPFPNPSEESYRLFLEYTMEAGVFGFYDRSPGDVAMKKTGSADKSLAAVVLGKLFPPASEMEARYTYLQKAPWLLPVGWIHRLLITRQDTTSHLQTAREIMHADREEIERLKRVQEELGL